LTVIVVIFLLALVQLGGWQTRTSMCELIGECSLRPTDIQRIQIVLAQAGLDQYQIVDNTICVPAGQRPVYLKAISDGDALPENLRSPATEFSTLNPFLSRSQQELMERIEKKKQIRELVTRLPFVDQAWFEMDESKSRSVFEPSRQTAVVSIQPTAGQALTTEQVTTVRQVVGGALAGINPTNIVVTDLSAGRAFRECETAPGQAVQQDRPSREKNLEEQRLAFYENKIRRLLSSYPGVDIEVHYQADLASRPNQNQFASSPTSPQLPKLSVPSMQVGTNGQASVQDFPSCADVNLDNSRGKNQEVCPTPRGNQDQDVNTASVERVGVVVSVPQECVEKKCGIGKVKRFLGWPLERRSENVLETSFEKLKSEMIETIRPALPVASFDLADSYPISILLDENDSSQATDWADDVQRLVSDQWPTLAVLLVGFMMLIVVSRTHVAKGGPAAAHTLTLDSAALASGELNEDSQPRSEAERRLSQLIEQDPDAAAKVIKSWIRKAA
jgi:flagellar biosynthesis/type III secretory pathway M-ring protein FliF/YscJ